MKRLTEDAPYPLTNFCKCQICGYEKDDICEFRMYLECDEQDKPEPYNILITCKSDECFSVIEKHERLYFSPAWGTGAPGYFMLLCSDCPHRKGGYCTHPDLKSNGGEGLLLHMAGDPIFQANICYHDADSEYGLKCSSLKAPFTGCAGLPPDDPNHVKEKSS